MVRPLYSYRLSAEEQRSFERSERVRKRLNSPYQPPMGWHSITCVCEECLDTDMAIDQYGTSRYHNFNLEGLSK